MVQSTGAPLQKSTQANRCYVDLCTHELQKWHLSDHPFKQHFNQGQLGVLKEALKMSRPCRSCVSARPGKRHTGRGTQASNTQDTEHRCTRKKKYTDSGTQAGNTQDIGNRRTPKKRYTGKKYTGHRKQVHWQEKVHRQEIQEKRFTLHRQT